MLQHIETQSFHARRGAVTNAFRYRVDYILTDEAGAAGLRLFSRNARNLWSLWDRNHGGTRGQGQGFHWFLGVLRDRGAAPDRDELFLLTQPSFLGYWFNPVSFWLWLRDGQLLAFVAEVNNTVGQRHCYVCANPGFQPIGPGDRIGAAKLMYVSPFQQTRGDYAFKIAVTDALVDIRIDYTDGADGVFATLRGRRRAATDTGLLRAALRRPFGAARVVALIHWQAVKLFAKRAPYFRKSPPPALVSDNRPGGTT